MDKVQLANKILRGQGDPEEIRDEIRMANGVIFGVSKDGIVVYDGPDGGQRKSATQAEFASLGKKYFTVTAFIANPCPPILNEGDLPEDI